MYSCSCAEKTLPTNVNDIDGGQHPNWGLVFLYEDTEVALRLVVTEGYISVLAGPLSSKIKIVMANVKHVYFTIMHAEICSNSNSKSKH